MAADPQQRRVVLHLHHGATERAAMRAAAELAQMLGLALHGFFLEDAALEELAELPFVREFRLGNRGWHKLDRARLAEEQRLAARQAQRLLEEVADTLGIVQLFEVVHGDPTLLLAGTSHTGDIIVVSQPRLPAERLVRAAEQSLRMAHKSGASVMLVPTAHTRPTGPIAVVVCSASDPALDIGMHMATAAGETLLLLVHGSPQLAKDVTERVHSAGMAGRRIVVRNIAGVSPEDVLKSLGSTSERLVVLSRGTCGADNAAVSSHIASERGVPVLIVET